MGTGKIVVMIPLRLPFVWHHYLYALYDWGARLLL